MSSLRRIIEETLQGSQLAKKLHSSAGATVGVIGPSSADVFSLGVGVDAGKPMEIGSLTKVFTALLLAEAVRRKELELSSRIDELLFGSQWPGPVISVQELVTHTSGLPRLGLPVWRILSADPYRDASRSDLMTYLQRKRPQSLAARRYRYSNLGYAALGLVLEKAAGRSYSELLDEWLFGPLRLQETLVQFTSGPDLVSPGYGTNGKGVPVWHAYAPCGGLVSTLNDLALVVRGLLDPNGPLAEATLLATRPWFVLDGGGHVGLGWMLPPGGDSYWHNGGTRGYASYLGIDSKRDLGVIVLANQGAAGEVTKLGTSLMRLIRGETYPLDTE